MENPPPAADLVEGDSLDEQSVVAHFGGKTGQEVYQMFADGAHPYTEDLAYMADAGLEYYLPAVLAYLQSDEAAGDWECVPGVVTSLSIVCERDRLGPVVRAKIRHLLCYVRDNLTKFELTADPWVRKRLRVAMNRLARSRE